jgi:protein PsiE
MMNIQDTGHKVLTWIRLAGLLIIALSTVIAVGFELASMFVAGKVTLADLLLLFIYLEVLEMVAVYLGCGKLPVRMPLYIAMIALARYLILDIKNLESWDLLSVSVATLILAFAILVLRYGHIRFPYDKGEDCAEKRDIGVNK